MSSAKKTLILILVTSLGFTSCRHNKDLAKHSGKEDLKHSDSNPLTEKLGLNNKEIKENKLYRFVNDWYGTPYKYGGCQKSGVDCSCFTDILYEAVYGVKIGRTAGEMYKECDKVHSDRMRQGDLVFFKINSNSISHVGVYLKDNKFVHASTSKGVMISDLNETYYKKYFYAAGRLKHAS